MRNYASGASPPEAAGERSRSEPRGQGPLCKEWARELPPVAFSHIYARDGLRCANPCCTRRDVTPHHIIYVSRGGTDEAGNLIALCVWCHLEGVHGGRLTVSGEAPGALRWMIGAHTVVEGRTRRRAAQGTLGQPVIPGREYRAVVSMVQSMDP